MGNDYGREVYRKQWPIMVKFFQVDETSCVHHGYYERGIRTHAQSVLNMNDVVGRLLSLEEKAGHGGHILDAGCGIGGTVLHLAKRYPSLSWTGITVVPEHVEIARELSRDQGVSQKTEFLVREFTQTGFPSEYFDAVYLLESACYAKDKDVLFRELQRILKPGGTLVLLDAFLTDAPRTHLVEKASTWFCKGWGLPGLLSSGECVRLLEAQGFREIRMRDLSKNVTRSILHGDLLSIPYLFSVVYRKMRLGSAYRIEDDTNFFGVLPVVTTFLGVTKAISYHAITALK
jgi:cyclopropane fatty-acyl-phospholipid synthase-like methyltransferase